MRSFTIVTVALLAACQETTTDNFLNPEPGAPATCTVVASLPGCDQGSISYSCTSDRPDDVGSAAGNGDSAQLVCSDGAPGPAGTSLYCCIPLSQYYTGCAPDSTIAGCVGAAVGFACTSGVAPTDADPTIACSAGQAGSDGAVRYCCNTAAISPDCITAGTATACSGAAVDYTCAGSATPSDAQPALACTGSGSNYCCTVQ